MIDSIITALQQPFFIRSLLMVILLASIFPLYGNIVVIRQEANIAHTFAHIALFGVAI
jgi:ABC-type Mn2+/Zn2+ transport system permease subunit